MLAQEHLVGRLAEQTSFPEAAITEATHGSTSDAGKVIDRSKTLDQTPDLASALDDGTVTAGHIDAVTQALFATQTPDTCPNDPIAKQNHLRALALARLITGDRTATGSGRPESVVVIDTGGTDSARPATGTTRPSPDPDWDVTWPIPVEVPHRVLHRLLSDHPDDVHPVIVRNGIVIHAPGQLDLGRTTRLANRHQRRALRGLYATCAVPGCRVTYDRCKLHHIIWWRHGGRTDLQNLLPVCTKHHANIHHDGWVIALGPNRELTITLPDGQVMTTGPPTRRAA